MARLFIIAGIVLILLGLLLTLGARLNLPLGRLPGDIVYRGRNATFYFPLMTSILLSFLLYLLHRFGR